MREKNIPTPFTVTDDTMRQLVNELRDLAPQGASIADVRVKCPTFCRLPVVLEAVASRPDMAGPPGVVFWALVHAVDRCRSAGDVGTARILEATFAIGPSAALRGSARFACRQEAALREENVSWHDEPDRRAMWKSWSRGRLNPTILPTLIELMMIAIGSVPTDPMTPPTRLRAPLDMQRAPLDDQAAPVDPESPRTVSVGASQRRGESLS